MNRRLSALLSAMALSIAIMTACLASDRDLQRVLEIKQHGIDGWIGMTFENAIYDGLPGHLFANKVSE